MNTSLFLGRPTGWDGDKKQIIVSAIVSGLAHAQNAFPHAQQIIVSVDKYTLSFLHRNNGKIYRDSTARLVRFKPFFRGKTTLSILLVKIGTNYIVSIHGNYEIIRSNTAYYSSHH
jgi:hypothetical protein